MIEITNIIFSYADNLVLNNLNLEIEDKEIIGLIGANGAGKTTLVKLLIGHLTIQKGTILYRDRDLRHYPVVIRKNIGVAFENSSYPSWINAGNLLVWVGQIRGLSIKKSEEEADYWLNKFSLLNFKNKPVSSFSAGMKQKFSLAVAFIGYPEFIILDEPTANLDVQSRFLINDLIKDINREYKSAFLLFSHALADLETICDRLGLLVQGKLLFFDAIQTLSEKYQQIFYRIKSKNFKDLHEYLSTNFAQSIDIIRSDEKFFELDITIRSIQFDEFEQKLSEKFKDVLISPKYSFLEDIFLQFGFKSEN